MIYNGARIDVEPLADGYGEAVFLNRTRFIGWVGIERKPRWDKDSEDFWLFEACPNFTYGTERYSSRDEVVKALCDYAIANPMPRMRTWAEIDADLEEDEIGGWT